MPEESDFMLGASPTLILKTYLWFDQIGNTYRKEEAVTGPPVGN
jgi:hypothetical protein